MLNIAIVEDNQVEAENLKRQLDVYAERNNKVFNVALFKEADSFLNFYKAKYDVVFMDIELPGISGMDAARKLREIDNVVVLIFVTSMKQFACDGYAVDALDFIVKPVMYARFSSVMDRVFRKLPVNDKDDEIAIRTTDGIKRLSKSSILFVEMQYHHVVFQTEENSYAIWGTMKKIKEQFPEDQFALCNSGYLVNLRYVSAIEGDMVIVRSHQLKISRPKRKSFLDALAAYLGGN